MKAPPSITSQSGDRDVHRTSATIDGGAPRAIAFRLRRRLSRRAY